MDEHTDNAFGKWQEMQKELMGFWTSNAGSANPEAFMKMDFGNTQIMMENWWKMQQDMFKAWSGQDSKLDMGKIFDTPWNSQADGVKKIQKFYQDLLMNTTKATEQFLAYSPSGIGKETISKIKQAGDLYMNLLTFWTENMLQIPDNDQAKEWQGFSSDWIANYNKVLADFFIITLPDPIKEIVKKSMETSDLFRQTMFSFLEPWFELAPELKGHLAKAFTGDRDSYKKFLHQFHNLHKESYGRMLRVPGLSLSNENLEQITDTIDSFMSFASAIDNFFEIMYKNGYEVMEDLMKKIPNMTGEEAPASFKDFYKIWWSSNENAYFQLFSTESFGKILGEVMNSGVKFRSAYDEFMTTIISQNFPIPTKQDMDSVYKTIYAMKKKVNAHDKKLEEMGPQVATGMEKKVDSLNKKVNTELRNKSNEISELKQAVKDLNEKVEKISLVLNKSESAK